MRNVEKLNRAALAAVSSLLAASSASSAFAQAIPSFSGADGAGAYTAGGRGGVVYHVTQLDTAFGQSAIAGTLQYGLSDSNFTVGGIVQPRTIVFDVGGTIWFGKSATDTEGWDSQDRISVGSNITIAGQTAPGGINIAAGTLKINGNQTILRNVSIAAGYGTRSIGADGIPDSYVYDAINVHADNVMIDHVSAVFCTDEAISADEFANHTSVQYCNVSQGQNYPQLDTNGQYTGHAFGSLWQPNTGAVTTIHHNLYAHQKGRLPRVGSTVGTGAINDFRNNVVYNWLGTAGTGASAQPSFNNFVGNFFLAGAGGENPVGGTTTAMTTTAGGTSVFNGNDTTNTRVYHSGNVKDTNKDGDANDGVALTNSDYGSATFVGSPYAVNYFGVTDSASAAFTRVLNYMGANWNNRSAIDQRIVAETLAGTGQITAWNDPTHGTEWNSLLALKAPAGGGTGGTGIYARAAGWDSDGDGMPDVWEAAHSLNPSVADNNGDYDADGYTNLEEYLNEIAEWPAPAPLVFNGSTNSRYEQITNWSYDWQPSKYDEAQINSGNVTINSVGQHADVLKVAFTAGSSATLTINAGWIDVANHAEVANNGQLIINGGQLLVPSVQLANNAVLRLTPGGNKTLKTGSISIANNAKVDVGDNKLVLTAMSKGSSNGSAYTGVTGLIATGQGNGTWNGPSGIVTTQSAATASLLTSIGIATAGETGYAGGIFGGVSVSANDVLVMYTYGGDANLDGQITGDDYFQIDSGFPAGATGWFSGDFNYDRVINVDDYFIIDSNFTKQGAPFPTGGGVASVSLVPEPASGGLFAIACATLSRRRRHRR